MKPLKKQNSMFIALLVLVLSISSSILLTPKPARALKCASPYGMLELLEVRLVNPGSETEDTDSLTAAEQEMWPETFDVVNYSEDSFQLSYVGSEESILISLEAK